MQILASLARNAGWQSRAHQYIGISRKPCFLCDQVLKNYNKISVNGVRQSAFKARQSHGKIYPLWTLPVVKIEPLVAALAMTTAVINTYNNIQSCLQEGLVLQAAIAESSVGNTDSASIVGQMSAMKRQYVANQRTLNSSEIVEQIEDPVRLGRKVKTVRVGLLPADGSRPRLIKIGFYALPDKQDRRVRETGNDFVPDLHKSWGECQFDRRYRVLILENQDIKELEGNYRLYWNENHELPENENIKTIIGVKKVNNQRRFWHGDAFVVRFSEHPQTFAYNVHDASPSILDHPSLENIFRHMWKTRFLEAEVELDRYFNASHEKMEADKDIILRRMLVNIKRLCYDPIQLISRLGHQ